MIRAIKIFGSIFWGIALALGILIANPDLDLFTWQWLGAAVVIIIGSAVNAGCQAVADVARHNRARAR